MRRPLTLLFLSLAASGWAAPLTLNVAGDGWQALVAKDPPAISALTDGVRASGGKIVLKDVPAGARVWAYDRNANLAVVGTPESLPKTISAEGATHLPNVTVTLLDSSDGKPKAYEGEAGVELKDDERTQKTRTTNGTARFLWVRVGSAEIRATTRGADNGLRTNDQRVQVDASGLSNYTVMLGYEGTPANAAPNVPTIGNGGGGTAATNAPASGGFLGNLLSTLVGLAVVGALAYGAWRYARANPDVVKGALTKIGADVPKPLDPDDPPATTASPTPAPAPSGPIILDPAPTQISVPATPISLSAAPTGIPKLVGTDGSAFELPEGETVVGREALGGLMISHETVSRRHARLVRTGPSVTVEDLGSTNGTWINDAPAPATLNGGEAVRFGQVSYRYEA